MLGGANSGAMHERGLISVWPSGQAVSPGANAVPRPPQRPPRPAGGAVGFCAAPGGAAAARIIDAAIMQVKLLRMAVPRKDDFLNLAHEGAGLGAWITP